MFINEKNFIIDSYKLVSSKEREDDFRLKFVSLKDRDKRLIVLDFKINVNFFDDFSDLVRIVKSIFSKVNNNKKFIIHDKNKLFVSSISLTDGKKFIIETENSKKEKRKKFIIIECRLYGE